MIKLWTYPLKKWCDAPLVCCIQVTMATRASLNPTAAPMATASRLLLLPRPLRIFLCKIDIAHSLIHIPRSPATTCTNERWKKPELDYQCMRRLKID